MLYEEKLPNKIDKRIDVEKWFSPWLTKYAVLSKVTNMNFSRPTHTTTQNSSRLKQKERRIFSPKNSYQWYSLNSSKRLMNNFKQRPFTHRRMKHNGLMNTKFQNFYTKFTDLFVSFVEFMF